MKSEIMLAIACIVTLLTYLQKNELEKKYLCKDLILFSGFEVHFVAKHILLFVNPNAYIRKPDLNHYIQVYLYLILVISACILWATYFRENL